MINTLMHVLFHNGVTFPVDCKVGDWKPWGECNGACGGGNKTRNREVVEEPKNGGASCPDLEETEVCKGGQCEGTFSFLILFYFLSPSCCLSNSITICNSWSNQNIKTSLRSKSALLVLENQVWIYLWILYFKINDMCSSFWWRMPKT